MVVGAKTSPVSAIVSLLRQGAATQAELTENTGMSRVTVHEWLGSLEDAGLVTVAHEQRETGGRPARRYCLNNSFGRILVADVGTSFVRAGIMNMRGELEDSSGTELPAFESPTEACREIFDIFSRFRSSSKTPIRAMAVGLPVPFNPKTDEPYVSNRHKQWDHFDVRKELGGFTKGPFVVGHDVDFMGLAEQRLKHPDTRMLMFVKVGMGIGCSVVYDGDPLRGEDGGAFEIGHVRQIGARARGAERHPCVRGHDDCLEAVAGGRAIASSLVWQGVDARSSVEIMDLAVAGNSLVRDELYASGVKIGSAIAPMIAMLNPGVVVVGGNLTAYSDLIYQGIRDSAGDGVPRMIRKSVTITPAQLTNEGGLIGAGMSALDALFSAENLEKILSDADAGGEKPQSRLNATAITRR
ncbi:putative NBD/HSP70 family sugar kinase [Arcanobacterium pluranimalium]|uniref:ROK family transcriptional regulator n=1 Tax=Arcanobacterium pluranimalium TaxID=108028 RepID=UPI00195A1F90|nr:ROK family transcriptional regulator [Arcanobacterium pluranimalium]MBM7825814.1 putative NBD/HSP70 family sugar kinase [Arcanobacterium pluranimalium]